MNWIDTATEKSPTQCAVEVAVRNRPGTFIGYYTEQCAKWFIRDGFMLWREADVEEWRHLFTVRADPSVRFTR